MTYLVKYIFHTVMMNGPKISICCIYSVGLFEEWVVSILHGRKALELLENRNSLYVLYIDRVIGVVAKQVGQLSFLQKLNPQILENLFS